MSTEDLLKLLPQPFGLWATLVVGTLLLVANVAPKFLPFGKAINGWFKSRRVEQRSVFDQRIHDRDERIRELEKTLREKDDRHARYRLAVADREDRWRLEWQEHLGWDFHMVSLVYRLGAEPPPDPAPHFMTPDPVVWSFSPNEEEKENDGHRTGTTR